MFILLEAKQRPFQEIVLNCFRSQQLRTPGHPMKVHYNYYDCYKRLNKTFVFSYEIVQLHVIDNSQHMRLCGKYFQT